MTIYAERSGPPCEMNGNTGTILGLPLSHKGTLPVARGCMSCGQTLFCVLDSEYLRLPGACEHLLKRFSGCPVCRKGYLSDPWKSKIPCSSFKDCFYVVISILRRGFLLPWTQFYSRATSVERICCQPQIILTVLYFTFRWFFFLFEKHYLPLFELTPLF